MSHVLVGNKFPPLFRKHDRVSRGTIHKINNSFSPDVSLIKLKHFLSHNLSDALNFCRVSLLAMGKNNFKIAAVLL